MKGAIGNAFILNMVITFIIIFFSLLIGSMAYSKAYKTKNYLLNSIENIKQDDVTISFLQKKSSKEKWEEMVNPYLGQIGYNIATEANKCPNKEENGYKIMKNTSVGDYEYCIYTRNITNVGESKTVATRYNYMVLVYMKFDLPIIGEYVKIPITGETKTYTQFY